MKLQHVIAVTLVFLLGSISLLMGALVLLGLHEAGHTVLKGLLAYNVVLGALSLLVIFIIWKKSRSTRKFVFLMLCSHTAVLAYLVLFVDDIAQESIRAMEVRVVVWVLVLLLIQWDTLKKIRVATLAWKNTAMFLGLSATFLFGCKQAPSAQKSEPQSTLDQIQVKEASHNISVTDNGWGNEIQLDQGNKWQANVETTLGVSKMRSTIDHTAPRTISEYRQLGNELNDLKNTLVKECTMTGPSHDNLHVWLYPLIKKIEALQNVDNEKSGRQLTQNIAQHLKSYNDFFK